MNEDDHSTSTSSLSLSSPEQVKIEDISDHEEGEINQLDTNDIDIQNNNLNYNSHNSGNNVNNKQFNNELVYEIPSCMGCTICDVSCCLCGGGDISDSNNNNNNIINNDNNNTNNTSNSNNKCITIKNPRLLYVLHIINIMLLLISIIDNVLLLFLPIHTVRISQHTTGGSGWLSYYYDHRDMVYEDSSTVRGQTVITPFITRSNKLDSTCLQAGHWLFIMDVVSCISTIITVHLCIIRMYYCHKYKLIHWSKTSHSLITSSSSSSSTLFSRLYHLFALELLLAFLLLWLWVCMSVEWGISCYEGARSAISSYHPNSNSALSLTLIPTGFGVMTGSIVSLLVSFILLVYIRYNVLLRCVSMLSTSSSIATPDPPFAVELR